MPRSYQHISNFENEILELKEQVLTQGEIGAKLDSLKNKYTISVHDTTKSKER